jgi:hypothetical protein
MTPIDLDFAPAQRTFELRSRGTFGLTLHPGRELIEGNVYRTREAVHHANVMSDREGVVDDLLGVLGHVFALVDEFGTELVNGDFWSHLF